MSVSLVSYGGAQEVTGSKHLLSSGKSSVMIDCGAFQGKREEADRKNREWEFDAGSLGGVILTHAHYDHSGLLPLLRKKGYDRNIFSTPPTRDLANIILMDSASIQAKDVEYLTKQAAKRGERFSWKPLYDEQDVMKTIEQFVTISYGRPFLPVPGMEACFFDAGHILGSSTVHITVNSGRKKLRVGFSGDLGRKGKPILRDPVPIPPVEHLVMESTYGDRLHEISGDILAALARIVRETASQGGKIIIPAFAVERTQDLIFYLHLLTDEKKIPDIPVYVDSPMAVNATAIFKNHPECYDDDTKKAFIEHHTNPFGFNSLRYIESSTQSKELNSLRGPAVIISSSGMCEAGRI
jgi:metallo-beta-lactamase family protein